MNNMRTPEEKEKILKEYLNGTGISIIVKKYEVRVFLIYRWLKKYNENGIGRLRSKLKNIVRYINTKVYIDYYNNERPSYTLNYKTPIQYKIESGF